MQRSEHAVAQHEADHHRWADDGGFIPEPDIAPVEVGVRSPWRVIGIAAAVGFAIGWLTISPRRGQ